MITSPQIEKYAFQGKCRWAVQWFGAATAGTIECPPGGFILLRQIIYRPFVDPNHETNASPYVHQLTLSEQGATDELQYIFRNGLTDTNAKKHQPNNDGEILETWSVYKRNIEIDLINATDSKQFVYAVKAPFSNKAQERQLPLGFDALNINTVVNLGNGENYHATGQQRPISGIPYSGAGIRDRMRFNVSSISNVNPVKDTDDNRDFQYPIIGFGMWIFNIPVSEYLNY